MVLIVVAVLYFARTVFIPIALAVLLAFLLAPLVVRLRRPRLGRVPAALTVMLFFFVIIGIVGVLVSSQLTELARELPSYQNNVHQKVEQIRASSGGLLGRISRLAGEVSAELSPHPTPPASSQPNAEKTVPVEIRRSPFSPVQIVQQVLGSALNVVLTAAIVVVFLIFILVERESLRDRLIRLGGARRVNTTTTMLDDAAHRLSRYLLAQLAVNAVYGVLAAVGVFLLGVPNPFLWGIIAMLLRYIPYVGIWIAAAMPALVALAVEPGWVRVPLVFAVYFGIDLVMYNFVEPLLYGSSTGLSPLAILVAAVFWTWLWGPVGLLLATPLTVCVVVLGRYIPQLSFLKILLSDEPVLAPATRFYQRMLALDLDEATEVAEEFLRDRSLEELYDSVIIPALSLAEEDRHQGRLEENRERYIVENTRLLIEDLGEHATASSSDRGRAEARVHTAESAGGSVGSPGALGTEVLCIPARDDADEIAAVMLCQLLEQRGISAKTLAAGALAGESMETINQESPTVACVLAVPPLGYVRARYLCRRLKGNCPNLKLVGAILTEQDIDQIKRRQPPLVADELASNIRDAVAAVLTLVPLRSTPPPPAVLAS